MQKRNIILVLLILVVLGAIGYLYFKNKDVKEEESRQQQIMNELENYKPDPSTTRDPEEIVQELNSFKPLTNENSPSDQEIMDALNSVKPE